MISKIIRIEYDPYNNKISFSESLNAGNTWQKLSENSALMTYQNQEFVFSNCVKDIVKIISDRYNTSEEGISIHFVGTEEDYSILKCVIDDENSKDRDVGKIISSHVGYYKSADEAIEIIRQAYGKISDEFWDYLPDSVLYSKNDTAKEIGDSISQFQDVISKEIPICVIGTYSVGKSALVNAIIGDEILPSSINPCTAKDVKVESDSIHQIEFIYKNESIILSVFDGGVESYGSSDNSKEIISFLNSHCNFAGKNAANVLHDILEAFNESEESFPATKNIGWNITVKCPFSESLLNQTNCKIVIFDTPGSNNKEIDQEKHRLALEELMGKQTNALPVFVVDRSNIVGNDSEEVKELLEKNKEGFSNPNCLIVVSKADNLTQQNLLEPIPPQVLNWHGNSTVLYVCPIGAIGEKKNGEKWLNNDYKEIYDEWKKTEKDQVILPEYNRIPFEHESSKRVRGKVSSALYASGIPTLEERINDYVERYANYKKCINGRDTLSRALNLAKDLHNKKQEELVRSKKEKEKEQEEIRKKLENEIDVIKIPSFVVSELGKKYKQELDDYCDSVLPEINRIWDFAKKSGKLQAYINNSMKNHCMLHFFIPLYEKENGIRDEIKRILVNNYAGYIENIRNIVNSQKNKLSAETNMEVEKIFSTDASLQFSNIELKGEGRVFWVFRKLPFLGKHFEEKYKENMAASICDQLRSGLNRGKDHKLGLFAEICIRDPAIEYTKQLIKSKDCLVNEVKQTLSSENAILSRKDEEIAQIEKDIEILQNRLNNLNSVNQTLENVLTYAQI